MTKILRTTVLLTALAVSAPHLAEAKVTKTILVVSLDGLRADAVTKLGLGGAPNLHLLMRYGASTLNARTDPGHTVTMPNHTCMLTGRTSTGPHGHKYELNTDRIATLHDFFGGYLASIFDVVHDHGYATALFAAKPKFRLFGRSYDASNGAPDKTGADNGRKKIDRFLASTYQDRKTLEAAVAEAELQQPGFIFVHFAAPDLAGHTTGFDTEHGSLYMKAVAWSDYAIGMLLQAIWRRPDRGQDVFVIVTTDHGGRDRSHHEKRHFANYRIPFIVWGSGVEAGADLYEVNAGFRRDPGAGFMHMQGSPIRNCDVANLSLKLLGLPAVPGSSVGKKYPLLITTP